MFESIQQPRVYLVSRPSLNESGLSQFFLDEGVEFSTPSRKLVYGSVDKAWECDTDNAAEIICMTAGKICYDAYGKGRSDTKTYLQNILHQKHGSVLEHANWSFVIAGVSRTFSHEHVRHRAGVAISQRSSRYVKEDQCGVIAQPSINSNAKAKQIWDESIEKSKQAYSDILELIAKDLKETVPDSTLRTKLARSAARSVLPQATETYIFWTANARALRHYIEMRAVEHAEIEIRRVAIAILKIMQAEAPSLFSDYTISQLPDATEVATTENMKV